MGRDRDVHGSGERTNTNLTRRELVHRAAWALAAGTISAGAAPLRAEDISPTMLKLSTLHERSAQRRVARQSAAGNQASYPRYFCRNDFWLRTAARTNGLKIRSVPTAGRAFARWWPRTSSWDRSRRPSSTGNSLTPMKPTMTTPVGERIRAAPSCRPRWRRAKKQASAGSISHGPWRSATTSGCVRFRPWVQGHPQRHARPGGNIRRCRGRGLRAESERPADALAARLRGATGAAPAWPPGGVTPIILKRDLSSAAARPATG